MLNPKYKKNAPAEISCCQHAALEWQFVLADGQWLCALVPTRRYTHDGYRESRFVSEPLLLLHVSMPGPGAARCGGGHCRAVGAGSRHRHACAAAR
jgi:hypothetical protein